MYFPAIWMKELINHEIQSFISWGPGGQSLVSDYNLILAWDF